MNPQLIRAIESVGEPNWTAVVQAVGAVATVVVVLFVWLQMRGLKQALHSETHSKLYAEDFEIIKLFVDRPHLRPYFYKNVEVNPGSPDEAVVHTIAELWCCHLEHVRLQLDCVPKMIRQSWADYAKFLYKSSPAIRICHENMKKEGVYIAEMDRFVKDGAIT
jgi:hypothetical protein